MSLGEQLKKLRESKGFSQEDVAKKDWCNEASGI
ncbi:helix-turn-helix domain-containing protein [Bacillus paranthracis]